jgi:hypothetical protein
VAGLLYLFSILIHNTLAKDIRLILHRREHGNEKVLRCRVMSRNVPLDILTILLQALHHPAAHSMPASGYA